MQQHQLPLVFGDAVAAEAVGRGRKAARAWQSSGCSRFSSCCDIAGLVDLVDQRLRRVDDAPQLVRRSRGDLVVLAEQFLDLAVLQQLDAVDDDVEAKLDFVLGRRRCRHPKALTRCSRRAYSVVAWLTSQATL